MKRIMREMDMKSEQVTHHINYLAYYRRWLEVNAEMQKIRDAASLKVKMTIETVRDNVERKNELRAELDKIYKECQDEVQRIQNKLGR